MKTTQSTCYIVDDNLAIIQTIRRLLDSVHIPHQSFLSAEEFEKQYNNSTGCLILDVRLKGMSGLVLQNKLKRNNCQLPIIFLSGHGNIDIAVNAMKQGAYDFITKPFHNQDLLDKVYSAMEAHSDVQLKNQEKHRIQNKINQLTPRELELLDHISMGKQTKQIAQDMEISINTAQIHRANLMKKMQASNLINLISMILKHKHYFSE